MKTRRAIAVTAAATAAFASVAGIAVASWMTSPSGNATGQADRLSTPGFASSPVTNIGTTSATINWSAPGGWQNSATYTATASATTGTHATKSCSAAASATSCQLTGLDPSTPYSVSLVASIGASWTSSAASTSFTSATPALAVSSVALNPTAGTSGQNATGQADGGDTVVITFSAAVKPSTICSGFSDAASTPSSVSTSNALTVTIANNAAASGNDQLGIAAAAGTCSGSVHFGTIDLGSTGFVTADKTYSGSNSNATKIAIDAAHKVLTITLGGSSSHSSQVTSSVTATYTPDSNITDSSSNTVFGTGTFNGVAF